MRLFKSSRTRTGSVEESGALLRNSLQAALEGDLERVEQLLTRVVRADPGDVDSHAVLGRVCRERGAVRRAVAIHQSLVVRRDLDPDQRIRTLTELGTSLQAGGQLRRAVAAFEEVLAYAPRHVPALRSLAEIQSERGEHARALIMLRRRGRVEGRRNRPAEARCLAALARAAERAGRPKLAGPAARRALRLDSKCVEALSVAGDVAALRGRFERAIGYWRRAAEIDSGRRPQLYSQISTALNQLGRPGDWLAWLRLRVVDVPNDTSALSALGRLLAAQPDSEAGTAEFCQLLELDRQDEIGHAALGRLLGAEATARGRVEALEACAELLDDFESQGSRASCEVLV